MGKCADASPLQQKRGAYIRAKTFPPLNIKYAFLNDPHSSVKKPSERGVGMAHVTFSTSECLNSVNVL